MTDKKIDWTTMEFFGGIVVPYGQPAPIPASAQRVQKMTDKLRKVQQDLIELANPLLCRLFLPLVQSYLNGLSGEVSTLELQDMSAMISNIRALMKKAVAED